MESPEGLMPLSNVDAAWLHMEDPTNLMMVTGIMELETRVELDTLKQILEEKLLIYERFKQRIVYHGGGLLGYPYWEDDPDFAVENHLAVIELPDTSTSDDIHEVASKWMSTQLDFDRPLWFMHLIQVWGRTLLLSRIHHSIADGMALMAVLLSLTTTSPDGNPDGDDPGSFFKSKVPKPPPGLLNTVTNMWRGAVSLGSLVVKFPDPKTKFKGKLGTKKLATWSKAIDLERIKAIKNATNTTVNDVLLAAMAGGLRQYLEEKGESTDGLNIRATVPVNLRKPIHAKKLGNRFGLVFLAMPIGIEDPIERLRELQARMAKLKKSAEPFVSFSFLRMMGMMPAFAQRKLVPIFGSKATAVMTNVPGPDKPFYFSGKKITNMMFWVPQSGHLGMGISIFSYNGNVRVGLATDQNLVPDPDRIIDAFYAELDRLAEIAKVD